MHDNRESWLTAGVRELDRLFFAENGYELPEKLSVSCGIPHGNNRAIGQCWDKDATPDKTVHMFICPSQVEPVSVLAILLHEMIHAAVGLECKHGGAFVKLARQFGLRGKITATVAEEGSDLHRELTRVAERLGPYPHSPLLKSFTTKKKKPAASGWLRMQSRVQEDYKVVISPKMLEEHGAPIDPWGEEMVPCNS